MDDNTKVLIHELMEKANENALDADRFDTLVSMILTGAELDYTGKALRVGNDESIMDFVRAIYTKGYFNTLAQLQKEKEEEKNDGK